MHTGGTVSEHGYQNLIGYRAMVVTEKLAVMMEERWVKTRVHGLGMVVDKGLCALGGRRDVEIENGMAERRLWRAGRWPAKMFGQRRFVDDDICNKHQHQHVLSRVCQEACTILSRGCLERLRFEFPIGRHVRIVVY